ncbi:MAG TPA: hypothetical protein VM753_25180 [Anaeromyxobacter sp.]|jgi:hypothetical protein|nr:hypothetical protein [Anaeromyxobacter sp.]
MNKLKLLLAGLLLAPALAFGQVRAGISIDLPVVLPPLVVVQPGVQVVPECDQEVFYTGGYYWVRQDGYWYRSRNHRGGWVAAPPRVVPAALVRMPPGHYRHWKAERQGPAPRPAGYDRGWGHDEEKHERKRWKEERKEERREWKHDHEHGHDRD